MHSVAVDELVCCKSIEAVHKLLFVKQEGLQAMVEGATVCHTALVQFIQLPEHCTKGNVVCKYISLFRDKLTLVITL